MTAYNISNKETFFRGHVGTVHESMHAKFEVLSFSPSHLTHKFYMAT